MTVGVRKVYIGLRQVSYHVQDSVLDYGGVTHFSMPPYGKDGGNTSML